MTATFLCSSDYSVVANSASDQTTVMQAFLDLCYNSGTHVNIGQFAYISAGTYVINGDLTIKNAGITSNAGGYTLFGHDVVITGTGKLILDSCKRVTLEGFDFGNFAVSVRGLWYGQFNSCRIGQTTIGDVAGGAFSSFVWTSFNNCQLGNVTVDAAFTEYANAITFNDCQGRGDTGQGFGTLHASLFNFNADRDCQLWVWNGGDASYYGTAIWQMGANQVSQDLFLTFNNTYFDSTLPNLSPAGRGNVMIEINNCHQSAKLASATSYQAQQAPMTLTTGHYAAGFQSHSPQNLIPNGDLTVVMDNWFSTHGGPIQTASSSTITLVSDSEGKRLDIDMPAVYATGTVTFTGTNGTLLPSGSTMTATVGAVAADFVTTADGTISAGAVTVPVKANLGSYGTAGKATAGTTFTLSPSVSGVTSASTGSTAFALGALKLTRFRGTAQRIGQHWAQIEMRDVGSGGTYSQQLLDQTLAVTFVTNQWVVSSLASQNSGSDGTVTWSGTNNVVIPAGTRITRTTGSVPFVTLSPGTIAGGTVAVPVKALDWSVAGTTRGGAAFTLDTPITGVTSGAATATIANPAIQIGDPLDILVFNPSYGPLHFQARHVGAGAGEHPPLSLPCPKAEVILQTYAGINPPSLAAGAAYSRVLLTASQATSNLTVTDVPQGDLSVGQPIYGNGIGNSGTVTITGQTSAASGRTGTYTVSAGLPTSGTFAITSSDVPGMTGTATFSGTTMTITAITGGTLVNGNHITANSLTGTITALGTPANGNAGIYTVSNSQTLGSRTMWSPYTVSMPLVTYGHDVRVVKSSDVGGFKTPAWVISEASGATPGLVGFYLENNPFTVQDHGSFDVLLAATKVTTF